MKLSVSQKCLLVTMVAILCVFSLVSCGTPKVSPDPVATSQPSKEVVVSPTPSPTTPKATLPEIPQKEPTPVPTSEPVVTVEPQVIPEPAAVVVQTPVEVTEAPQAVLVPEPALTGYDWIYATMAKYGVYASPDTTIVVGTPICGDACTEIVMYSPDGPHVPGTPITLTMSPHVIGDEHLLFHEIAHTWGIGGECAANAWVTAQTGLVGTAGYSC